MREYLVTTLVAAVLCYLVTPFVKSLAIRFGAVAEGARDHITCR